MIYAQKKRQEQCLHKDSNEEQEITSAEDEEIVKIAKGILYENMEVFLALANLENSNFEE